MTVVEALDIINEDTGIVLDCLSHNELYEALRIILEKHEKDVVSKMKID